MKVGADASIFSDPLVVVAKKSFREDSRVTSERRLLGKGKKSGRPRLPACHAFLPVLREWASEKGLTVRNKGVRRASYLACAFMFNFGVRFSNVGCGGRIKDKHTVKRRDVVFEDESGRRFSIPQYAVLLKGLGCWGNREVIVKRVVCMVIFIHSLKVRKVVGRIEILGRRSKEESEFLDDLVFWCLEGCGLGVSEDSSCGLADSFQGGKGLFSRGHVGASKTKIFYTADLSEKNISIATKCGAKLLNLDEKCYSAHSWKIGSITDLSLQGESQEAIRRLGDHSADSACTFIYQHPSGREARPLMLASSGKGLTVKDIDLVCPIKQVSSSDVLNGAIVSPLAEVESFSEGMVDLCEDSFSDSEEDSEEELEFGDDGAVRGLC